MYRLYNCFWENTGRPNPYYLLPVLTDGDELFTIQLPDTNDHRNHAGHIVDSVTLQADLAST